MATRRASSYDIGSARICVFVRHGESVTNTPETISSDLGVNPLTGNGIEQARFAAAALEGLPRVDSFYTSPVLRARQTADVISERIGTKAVVEPLLAERDYGKADNTRFRSKTEHGRFTLGQVEGGYPDIERWDGIGKRVRKFLGKLELGRITVAVSHFDPKVYENSVVIKNK